MLELGGSRRFFIQAIPGWKICEPQCNVTQILPQYQEMGVQTPRSKIHLSVNPSGTALLTITPIRDFTGSHKVQWEDTSVRRKHTILWANRVRHVTSMHWIDFEWTILLELYKNYIYCTAATLPWIKYCSRADFAANNYLKDRWNCAHISISKYKRGRTPVYVNTFIENCDDFLQETDPQFRTGWPGPVRTRTTLVRMMQRKTCVWITWVSV